ncbi:glycoside hydrolase family 97 protein [Acidaminobacter sp. JC074]|uniref:glycoside hydrolase family 97 protein n=1 Tax=Acidaminobacter sp. JC074 TaxID=2530199 RepID=UPI001F0FC1E7|nr:glycoside hydrolase family 97 protein [Acidaminobacter sp. JC074]MCH4887610.1 glycoside hydrolase family 97 protein [Acidaminobacter sp. JC074]
MIKKSFNLESPDGNVKVKIELDKSISYQVYFGDQTIIKPSSLSMVLKHDLIKDNLEFIKKETARHKEVWKPILGQKSSIKNDYNEEKIMCTTGLTQVTFVFRAFNDGLAFRYILNADSDMTILEEASMFNIDQKVDAWWIPNDWDSYEYLYHHTKAEAIKEVSTPVTFKNDQGICFSIHEAALVNYSGMALKGMSGGSLKSHLCPWPDGRLVKGKKEIITPWRTIMIGENESKLVESDMILNLNDPCEIKDTSWIKPMKYMGVWWEMHINQSDWGRHNSRHGARTENVKRYVDFIKEHLIEAGNSEIGLLVEGWNKTWDGHWPDNYNDFIFTADGAYDDFDLSEVIDYCKKNQVAYIMHNETGGGILNYDKQRLQAYSDYEKLGIHAIKSGYVAGGPMKDPKGLHHHGQYMIDHYNQAVIDGLRHKLMINTHEPIKDTGLSRTYPNWATREGVRGMEYNAWSEGNPPDHTTILPFTRGLAGPMDYTPGIFDVIMNDKYRVHTTVAKQLALYIVLYSPFQMIADVPENYLDADGKPLTGFKFIQDLALDWDKTCILNGQVGKYITTARKTKGKDEWFIGSITNEESREVTLSLDFLDEGIYQMEVYKDAEGTDYLTSPMSLVYEKSSVNCETQMTLKLPSGGGQAIRLYRQV